MATELDPMRILGIGTHISAGSALLEDGRIVAAVNDERLIREKMVLGFPRESIRRVLQIAGISPDDLDLVAVATKRQHLIDGYQDFRNGKFEQRRSPAKQAFFTVGSKLSGLVDRVPGVERSYYMLQQPFYARRRARTRSILRDEFNIRCPVEFVDHHLAHAASALCSSAFDAATIVTLDSAGDGLSSRVFRARGNTLEELHRVSSYNSPCPYYSYVTQISGFKGGKHEGKITGLAAHGKPIYGDVMERFLVQAGGTFRNVGGLFFYSGLDALREALPAGWRREDLAATVQEYFEDITTDYIAHWLRASGEPDVALAGGLFANVRINQAIHQLPGVRSIHVHPGMTDEGLGVGAALALYYGAPERATVDRPRCFDHVYLGPEYSDAHIRRALEDSGLPFERHDFVEAEIARLLARGHVVARFNGRMEYGPRALGNRSILYQPTDPSVNDWLNAGLHRTEFMPFAPSTLIEDADCSYQGLDGARDAARFMTITFDCTPTMHARCGGVVHVDGTARPHLVSPEDNPSFYAIISEFKKLTGLGTIINTSFNIHEEPIVCSPEDALRAFRLGHLDYLAIGDYVAKAAQAPSHPVKAVEVVHAPVGGTAERG